MSRSGSIPRSRSDKSKHRVFEEDVDPHLKPSITTNNYNFTINILSRNNNNNSDSNNGSKSNKLIITVVIAFIVLALTFLVLLFHGNLKASEVSDDTERSFEINTYSTSETIPSGTP